MDTVDRELVCRDCNATFLFSAGEQDFFRKKGLSNEPKRCPNCRLSLRARKRAEAGEPTQKLTEVRCSRCNAPTKVPFEPKGYKPVYCVICLHAVNSGAATAATEAEGTD